MTGTISQSQVDPPAGVPSRTGRDRALGPNNALVEQSSFTDMKCDVMLIQMVNMSIFGTLLANRTQGIGFPLGRQHLASTSFFHLTQFSKLLRLLRSNMMTQPCASL